MARISSYLIPLAVLMMTTTAHGDWIMEYWYGPDGLTYNPVGEPLSTPPYFRTGIVIGWYPLPGHEDDWNEWGLGAIFNMGALDPAQDDLDGDGFVDFSIQNYNPDGQLVWTHSEETVSWADVAQWKTNPDNSFLSLDEPEGSLADHSPIMSGLWSFSFYCEGDLISVEHALITPEPMTATLWLLGASLLASWRKKRV